MIGYVDNNFRAIIKPKKDINIGGFYLIPELEYQITRQEEPIENLNNPRNLKRTFIQGAGGVALWFGNHIEDHFDIIRVLRERKINQEDLINALKAWREIETKS
jgi:hypothetical protein